MHPLTRRHLLKLGLASGALVAAAAATSPVQALVNIVVSGGNFTPLPIAIPDFGGSDPAFGQQIAQIVRDNLSRSGLFAPLPPEQMQGILGDVDATPAFAVFTALPSSAFPFSQTHLASLTSTPLTLARILLSASRILFVIPVRRSNAARKLMTSDSPRASPFSIASAAAPIFPAAISAIDPRKLESICMICFAF